MTGFTIDVDHNEFMAEGDTVVDAIVTVTSTGEAVPGGEGDTLAQVLIIDCSGSMTGARIAEAKRATAAALDALPDGVSFAIVSGATIATMAYPTDEKTAVLNADTRAAAKKAIRRLSASGGTAMGTWLTTAARVLAEAPTSIKHALLLTDGFNQHESRESLQEALDACKGEFVCDAVGIGSDWHAEEIRLIADGLLGQADGLPDQMDWETGFAAITRDATKKTIADLALRVFTPARNDIRFIKQMNPHIIDLSKRRTDIDDKTGDYATGAWGAESREFHISVDVPPITTGDDRLAARISVVAGTTELARGMVTAKWTGDTMLSTKLNPRVAHYTGQAELAAAIQEGIAAHKRGDTSEATNKLGKAMTLAKESGHDNTAKLLAKVVDVDDAGTIQLKSNVKGIDLEMADVASTKTVTVRKRPDGTPPAQGARP
ncbi:VWA domain-containing protein [Stackebrandtia soli]|uniref:VWA domain-containing protein n=1 Tax=Stackebrandtia soli TaxID=1892856 RepID=UPI0039E91217